MEVFINGEIYLKKEPEVFSAENDALLNNVLRITDDVTSMIDDDDAIDEINGMKNSLLESIKEREGTLDYSRCSKFYRLITDGNDIILKSLGENFINTVIKCKDFKGLSEEFESLASFLENASFVGKHFKALNPIAEMLGIKCLALYKKEHTLVAKIYDDDHERYTLISSDEVLRDELEYIDEADYSLNNIDEVYKGIRQQFSEGYGRKLF